MGRLWRRRKPPTHSDEPPLIRTGTLDPAVALAARARSEAQLAQARTLGVEARHAASTLRALNERNHYAEMIERSMRRT